MLPLQQLDPRRDLDGIAVGLPAQAKIEKGNEVFPQVFLPSELTLLANTGVWTRWWTSGTDLGREGHWYWASSLAPLPGIGIPSGQPHMGQFLQGGKNGRLMSFFFKVEPPCDQT